MRRYVEIRVRLIADDSIASESDIEDLVRQALLNAPQIDAGEVDVLANGGDEVKTRNGYAIPLPALRDEKIDWCERP